MFSIARSSRRPLILCAALLASVAATACDDEGTPPEPEPEVATIRVTVGTSTIDIPYPTGTHTAIPLRVNQANQVSFRFLGADGQDEPIIVDERANLQLRMSNLQAGWTFAATGGSGATFTANITPTATGTFIPQLELFNAEHGHNEVQRTINVSVTQ
jgi:hypothetical protein